MLHSERRFIEDVTLASLVRAALDTFDGDADKASEYLFKKLLKDQSLLRQVIRSAIGYAVYHKTQETVRKGRSEIVNLAYEAARMAGAKASKGPSRDDVEAKARIVVAGLLDFPLAGGKKLRDATREEIAAQADRYEKQIKDEAHKARWLRLIEPIVPEGELAGEVLTEEQVQQLWNMSDGEAA